MFIYLKIGKTQLFLGLKKSFWKLFKKKTITALQTEFPLSVIYNSENTLQMTHIHNDGLDE